MYKISILTAALLLGSSTSLLAAPAQTAEKPRSAVATVNGVAIKQSTADAFLAEQRAQGTPDGPELKNAVREELIRRELLAQEAKKLGVDKKPAVTAQADIARQAVIIRAYIQEYVKSHPITEEQLKKDYEIIKGQLGGTEYKSRHILVEKEEDARAIIENLKKGARFEELATQSKDPGSRENGGDLGWSSAASYVKPFAEALSTLEKGKYTQTPVKSEFGYHVILLEDSRPLTPPPFEAIKQQLAQRAQQQQIEKMVSDLRAKAKVD